MKEKWKICSYEFEWFDIKTKFKQSLRRFAYSKIIQELICTFLSAYMRLVYLTSKNIFVGEEKAIAVIRSNKTIILSFWHNRLMMVPFLANKITAGAKDVSNFRFMTLASKHGDGRFVGRTMEKFNFISVLGSTNDGRKKSRGIDLKSLRQIFAGFKKGNSLGMTPDGPRGPNQKINGEIVNIARISGAVIFPISYSSSLFKELNSWDKFKIPLPFSTLCFYVEDGISVAKETDEKEIEKIENFLTERMNFAQDESLKIAQYKTRN
jgi:lysophospholipid acyltransferase (LPLAT)-like uncharacterized protein